MYWTAPEKEVVCYLIVCKRSDDGPMVKYLNNRSKLLLYIHFIMSASKHCELERQPLLNK